MGNKLGGESPLAYWTERLVDKTIICRDCNNEFVFTVGEQEFYKEKGFDNEPTRCVSCRRAKKEQNRR